MNHIYWLYSGNSFILIILVQTIFNFTISTTGEHIMRNKFSEIVFMAGILLALAFIYSCSSGGGGVGGGDDSSSSAGGVGDISSSSAGGGKNKLSSSVGDAVSSSSLGGAAVSSSSSVQPSSSSSEAESSSSSFNGNSSSSNGGYNISSSGGTSDTFIDSRDGGKTYKWVKIGEQYWMAENLSYNATGSKCYAEGVSGVSSDSIAKNCARYGRLYDWSTAMGISTSYNSSYYNPSASIKYRGVCPEGWHIPNNAEWDKLMRYVDGSTGTSSPYDSPTAGRYLKAKDGWYNCGPSGSGKSYSCEDTHGFFALPGGDGYSGGSFYDAGYGGLWWSSSENDSDFAYYRSMYYRSEYAGYDNSDKYGLFSVHCLQD
jgi:uncharacterized protein (TIGR02145 family)